MSRQHFTARPYGKLIENHILDTQRCGVWAGMGMGKTVSTLNALDILELVEPGPTLVCAPLRVAQSTWPDEARKWAHLRNVDVVPIVGDAKARTRALARAYLQSASIFTINYENLPWLEEILKIEKMPWPFRRIVSDESTKLKGWRGSQQTSKTGTEFVRGAGAQRSRVLARVAFSHATRFIELTGNTETVERIYRFGLHETESPRVRAIIDFCEALSITPPSARPEHVTALREQGLDDADILDLAHSAAIFGWANRLMHTLGHSR